MDKHLLHHPAEKVLLFCCQGRQHVAEAMDGRERQCGFVPFAIVSSNSAKIPSSLSFFYALCARPMGIPTICGANGRSGWRGP